jgi:hypothetical protein
MWCLISSRYTGAGARHLVVRIGALDIASQLDQLDRVAQIIPILKRLRAACSSTAAAQHPARHREVKRRRWSAGAGEPPDVGSSVV